MMKPRPHRNQFRPGALSGAPGTSFMYHRFPTTIIAVLSLAFGATVPLDAQDAPATNSPPAEATSAPAAASFLTNGTFDTQTQPSNPPDGWTRENDGLITREEENGKPFIRLVSQQPEQLVQISQTVALPAGIKGINYYARFRTANVKFGKGFTTDARTLFQFLDANGGNLQSPGAIVFDSHAHDWTEIKRLFLVPDGAARITISLCLNRPASGTLDVAEVSLSPASDADTTALIMAPALEAKKKSADEAEAQRMATLPSITPEIKVSGAKLVTADGKDVWLQGVNVPSLGWSAKGENVPQSVKVALEDWKANVIRLPVIDSLWFGHGRPPQSSSNDPEAYRQIVDNVVKMAAGQGAYVVLDLHRYHAPDQSAVDFWKDAAARYKNNPAVLFDIFNEPTGVDWPTWRNGGTITDKKKGGLPPVTWQSVGMQGLVDAVRSTGAKNIIIAGGVGNAYDLGGILQGFALDDPSGNGIMYATHFYNWHKNWQKHFLGLVGKYPLFVGEMGADIKKMPFIPANQQENPTTWVPDALGMIQQYHLNWTAFSLHPKATPVLISNWDFDPTPFFGVYVKDALAGKSFPPDKLR
jgi:endoglucanase